MNLATLTSEIVRRIIDSADSVDELRLISNSWNSIVHEYLTSKPLGGLERLCLLTVSEYDGDYWTAESVLTRAHCRVQMLTIVPERKAARVGVGSWLSHYKQRDDAIEASSLPQRVEIIRSDEPIEDNSSPDDVAMMQDLLNFQAAAAFSTAILAAIERPEIGYFLLGVILVMAIPLFPSDPIQERKKTSGRDESVQRLCEVRHKALLPRKNAKRNNISQVGRFVSLFSHIDTLVLDNFNECNTYLTTADVALEAVQNTLDCIEINRLEVSEQTLDDSLQYRIVDMCHYHRVRHLFIIARNFSTKYFREFVRQLVAMGVVLDVYQIYGLDPSRTFKKSKTFWDAMAAELADHQISLRMITRQDPSFSQADYGLCVRAYIRCERFDGQIDQPLAPVNVKRGYKRSVI